MEEHYYRILGLQKGASLEEIKKAYQKYAAKFHPDKHSGDDFFKERFQEVQEAYEYLTKNYEQPKPEIINFSVSKQEIVMGEFIEVCWETKNAKNVIIEIDRGNNYEDKTYDNLNYTGKKRLKISNFDDEFTVYLLLFSFSGRSEDCISDKMIVKKKTEFQIDNLQSIEVEWDKRRKQEEQIKRNKEIQRQQFEKELEERIVKAQKGFFYRFLMVILGVFYPILTFGIMIGGIYLLEIFKRNQIQIPGILLIPYIIFCLFGSPFFVSNYHGLICEKIDDKIQSKIKKQMENDI